MPGPGEADHILLCNLRNGRVLGLKDPKKALMQESKLRMMLICFFDQEGIVHWEFVTPGMTVNADFYCDVLRLRENVRRNRPQKWQNQNLIIQHDNAPTHRSFKFRSFWPRTT